MEIKNSLQKLVNPYQNSRLQEMNAQKAQQQTSTEATPSKGDTVNVSPQAKLMTEAYTSAMSTPDIRQDKVDTIKARIASGEYSTDSKNIATQLLQTEAEMNGLVEG